MTTFTDIYADTYDPAPSSITITLGLDGGAMVVNYGIIEPAEPPDEITALGRKWELFYTDHTGQALNDDDEPIFDTVAHYQIGRNQENFLEWADGDKLAGAVKVLVAGTPLPALEGTDKTHQVVNWRLRTAYGANVGIGIGAITETGKAELEDGVPLARLLANVLTEAKDWGQLNEGLANMLLAISDGKLVDLTDENEPAAYQDGDDLDWVRWQERIPAEDFSKSKITSYYWPGVNSYTDGITGPERVVDNIAPDLLATEAEILLQRHRIAYRQTRATAQLWWKSGEKPLPPAVIAHRSIGNFEVPGAVLALYRHHPIVPAGGSHRRFYLPVDRRVDGFRFRPVSVSVVT